MKKKTKLGLKALLAAVLIAALLPVHAAFAEEHSVLPFADVSSTHWAQKYIDRMALKGVVNGYEENGARVFRPEHPVSQQEAVLMALRLMGLEDDALNSNISYVLELKSGNFFKPFIDYAISIGLINYQEEMALMGMSHEGVMWGEKPATREWIARLTIRAIGQKPSEESELTFGDEHEISAWAFGYVNTAANLGIVTGRGGNFAPHDPVTRAEMATFLSRADAFLEQPDSVAVGLIRSVSGSALSIQDDDGRLVELSVDANTRLYAHDQNAPIYWFDVKPLHRAYVIHSGGKALYLELLDDGVKVETVQVKLLGADPASLTLTVEAEGQTDVYSYEQNVLVVDADGGGLKFTDLVPQSEIELQYTTEPTGERKVTQIRLISAPVNKVVENGTIQHLDLAAGNISLYDRDNGVMEQFPLSASLAGGTKAVPYGSRSLTVDDLRNGDKISYTVVNSVVTEITLIDPVEPILMQMRGEVRLNDLDRNELFFVPEGDPYATSRPYASQVEVVLEGVPSATKRDIEAGDSVTLTLDSQDRIVKVVINNRSIASEYMVTFLHYDEVTKGITTRMGTRNQIYYLTNDTKIYSSVGTEIPHNAIRTSIAEGQKLDIVYSTVTNQLLSARVSGTYDGTIAAIDRINNKLTVNLNSGGTITFDIRPTTFLEVPGKQSSAGLGDFSIGQEVKVSLSGTQSDVTLVQLKQTQLLKIESVNTGNRRLVLVAEDGTKREETLLYSTSIRSSSGASANFSDLKAGMDIYAKYLGRNVTEVHIANVSWGRVTAVDASTGAFTIVDYNGRNLPKRFDNPNRVPLSEGDRVYVLTNPEGHQSITVMAVLERKWRKYDPANRQVSFYKKTANEQSVFTVHANAAVFRGSSPMLVESLADGDEVTVWLYNGMVMEIVKK